MPRLLLFLLALCIGIGAGAQALVTQLPKTNIAGFQLALPGYHYHFPADHAAHPDYQTEWWYYTGHLKDDAGKRYGFELTFFRLAVPKNSRVSGTGFDLAEIYPAHFAITDIDGKRFNVAEKLNRSHWLTAQANPKRYHVINQDWQARRLPDGRHWLKATMADTVLELTLEPVKAPVIHGEDGASQKAGCYGCASHYYSFTRLAAKGQLSQAGEIRPVTGQAWMDHEFGSNQLAQNQRGWDWFSIQLDDRQQTELMLYMMRRDDGSIDPYSSGTYVMGPKAEHLEKRQYHIEVLDYWQSRQTGARYPAQWRIQLPEKNLFLEIEPLLADQELVTSQSTRTTYWEGACKVTGNHNGQPVKGKAYVELTGYAGNNDGIRKL